ncbi:MAG: tail assembly protein [Amphiplicatus sp.]
MLRTVRLSGELGRRYGRYHRFDVRTPAEAVRALCANFKDFADWLVASQERGVAYRVLADRAPRRLEELHEHTPADVITICPVLSAAGKNGLVGIIAGVALVAASFFLPAAPLFAALPGALGSLSLSGIAFSIGTSLLLGGITSILSKPPKLEEAKSAENKPSYYFNGPIVTSGQGDAVPIGYGRAIVGGIIIGGEQVAEELALNE